MLAAREAAKDARRRAQVELMERNYLSWHTAAEAALEADKQQAEDKAAAEAEAQRLRCVVITMVDDSGVACECIVSFLCSP